MSDLRRLRPAETTEFERELLESWQRSKPSPDARQKALMIAGLGAGAALGGSAAASGAAGAGTAGASIAPKAASLSAVTVLKWVLGGVLVLGAATTAVHYAPRFESGPAAAPVSSAARIESSMPATAEPIESASPAPAASAPSASSESESVAPALPPKHAETVRSKQLEGAPPEPAQSEPPAATSALAAQVAALDEARAALAAGDAVGAARRIDEYEKRFPRPLLAQEARVMRIEALLKQGRRAEAVDLGRRFLGDHPTSSYAARVRLLIGERDRSSE